MSLKPSERKLLIDGDIVAFTIAAACEEATKWDDDLWTLHASAGESVGRCFNLIEGLKETLFSDHVVVALSDKRNFRKELTHQYKANRVGARKPMTYQSIKEFMTDKYETVIYPGLEADDVLGILATTDDGFTKTIVTNDKDLRTIPTNVYFLNNKPMGLIEEIDEATADYNFYKQVLTGDRADGYPGCPTIGEKTAEKLLKPFIGDNEAMQKIINEQFSKQGLGEEEVLLQSRLARILRNGEYNLKEAQPVLWGSV